MRSLGVLVAFQLLAVAVVASGVRGGAGRLTLSALAVLAGIGIVVHSFDPVAHFAGALLAGWLVLRGARRGAGLGRISVLAAVPVLVATALTLGGNSPRQSWAELRSQVEVVAGVDPKAETAAGISPEERMMRERPAAPVLLNVNVPDIAHDKLAGIETVAFSGDTDDVFSCQQFCQDSHLRRFIPAQVVHPHGSVDQVHESGG